MYDLIDDNAAIVRGHQTFLMILDMYETPMFRCVILTCTFLIHDVFDEMFVMVRMGQVKSLTEF